MREVFVVDVVRKACSVLEGEFALVVGELNGLLVLSYSIDPV